MKASVCRTILGAAMSAVAFCWSGAEAAEDIWGSTIAITAQTGINVDEIAAYLTLAGGPPVTPEPRLVRWDQTDVSLGLVLSRDTPAPLVETIVKGIQGRFEAVNRRLTLCVRSWPGRSDIVDRQDAPVADCESNPTEIDVMISVSERALLSGIEALPSDPTHTALKDTWSRIRIDVLAQPTLHLCNAGYVTDATAQKLVGAAGMVWIPPTEEKKALELAEYCSRNLGFYLLGSVPVLDDLDGNSGTLSPDLLALLYSDQFKSGQSRSEVLAILRAAQP